MPDVSSNASLTTTRVWVALDVHKNAVTAGVLPVAGGEVELSQLENSEKAIRRLIARLGGPEGIAVCYEAGPCGYDLYRLLVDGGGVRHRRAVVDSGAAGRPREDRPS